MTTAAPDDLLRVSTRMLACAQAGEWDDVALQEAERARLLASLPVTDPRHAETLKTLLAHNEQVVHLAGCARDALDLAMGQHQHRHRALSAYLDAGVD